MNGSTQTVQALENITDAAAFETLAVRVLRIEEEDCRRVEHTGVGASGKTKVDPLDGFCLVPGSVPPRFIMVACTTVSSGGLKRKWLFDHTRAPRAKKATEADDGDVTKASRLAEAMRTNYPQGEFILHLCTNRGLDSEFMREVYEEGTKRRIEIVFLGQSRIRDCLDMKPEGQWLRQEHLGIQAVLLSPSLLKEISKESLKRYGMEFLLTPPEHFVSTRAQRVLEESINKAEQTLNVLTGPSGYGKSVISYQVLRKHVESGGLGIRVPGEVVSSSVTLEDAVETTLRSLHPTIYNGSGSTALNMGGSSGPLMIVVDDVNRSMRPAQTIKKVVGWTRSSKTTAKEEIFSTAWHVIMPAWDLYWTPLDREFESIDWVNRLPIGLMCESDALACLKSALGEQADSFTDNILTTITSTLHRDPILLAVYAEVYRRHPEEHAEAMATDAMERFIDSAIADEAASTRTYVEGDFWDSLKALARSMLIHRDLYPKWADLVTWLPDYQVQILRALSISGRLFGVITRNRESRCEYRHDRILEHFVTDVFCTMLQSHIDDSDVLEDPFFVNFLGSAIARTQLPQETISWVRAHAPLALIAAISGPRFESNNGALPVVESAKGWLSEAWNDPSTSPALIFEACRLLEKTDSPLVLTITESMSAHPNVARARLANGDVLAGAVELSSYREEFWPRVNDPWFDQIIERALRHHGPAVIENCGKMLGRTDLGEKLTYGALSLAGYIGKEELSDGIRTAWNSTSNKMYVLTPALWAALRCGGEHVAIALDSMMAMWASLSDDGQGGRLSERSNVAEDLRFAMRYEIHEKSLQYLVDVGFQRDELRYAIAHSLEEVDHPIAVKYLVTVLAKLEYDSREAGGFSIWASHMEGKWDPRNHLGRRLSPSSIEALRFLWQDAKAEEWLRSGAFNCWVKATDDLTVLQEVEADHPLFDRAIWRRALLGDTTIIGFVKAATGRDKKWFHVVAPIWTSEFLDSVDSALFELENETPDDFSGGRTNDHYMLSELLRDIPSGEAENLLTRHWERLQFSPLFVQVALYIGSKKTVAMVDRTIKRWPSEAAAFEHLGSFFGFFVHGLSDRLGMNHLEAVRSYLEHLDDHAIHDMVRFCQERGYRHWSERHLRPEVLRRRAQQEREDEEEQPFIVRVARHEFPSDKDLLTELDRIEQQKNSRGSVLFWCEGFGRRQDQPDRWKYLVESWLSRSLTSSRLKIAAEIVMELGSRQDLNLVAHRSCEAPAETLDRLVADMRFWVMRRTLQ